MYKNPVNDARRHVAAWLVVALLISAMLPVGLFNIGAAFDTGGWNADPPGTIFDVEKIVGVEDLLLHEPGGVEDSITNGVDSFSCTYVNATDEKAIEATKKIVGNNWYMSDVADDPDPLDCTLGAILRQQIPNGELVGTGCFLKAFQYVQISMPDEYQQLCFADVKFHINKDKYDPKYVRVLYAGGPDDDGLDYDTELSDTAADEDGVIIVKTCKIVPNVVKEHTKWAIFYFGPMGDDYEYTYEATPTSTPDETETTVTATTAPATPTPTDGSGEPSKPPATPTKTPDDETATPTPPDGGDNGGATPTPTDDFGSDTTPTPTAPANVVVPTDDCPVDNSTPEPVDPNKPIFDQDGIKVYDRSGKLYAAGVRVCVVQPNNKEVVDFVKAMFLASDFGLNKFTTYYIDLKKNGQDYTLAAGESLEVWLPKLAVADERDFRVATIFADADGRNPKLDFVTENAGYKLDGGSVVLPSVTKTGANAFYVEAELGKKKKGSVNNGDILLWPYAVMTVVSMAGGAVVVRKKQKKGLLP
ncbi:MAG: hypothetical protein FWD16_04235 [Clostridia bacterium]|nr:hypothetical protein [Clostridia bacterium]